MLMPVIAAAQTQTTLTDDLEKQIGILNETNKAILEELREIHKLLQQQQQQQPVVSPRTADASLPQVVDIRGEPSRGRGDAKVALIEFSDYQCPFCGRYERETYPQLLRDYVETGKVRYIWRDLPLDAHRNAEKAAEAAHCAGAQGKFWEMHDRLFADQRMLTGPDLVKHAGVLKLDAGQFETCLNSGRFAAAIKKDVAEANAAGMSGTPAFLIGIMQPDGSVRVLRKLVGAKPYATFKSAIDSALATP